MCKDDASRLLQRALTGVPIQREDARNCMDTLAHPPGGSGNWPVVFAAAFYCVNLVDGRGANDPETALLTYLSAAHWGLNGSECGSVIYQALNLAAVHAVHKAAGLRGDTEMGAAAKSWLRAHYAFLALHASANRPDRMEVYVAGERGSRKPRDDAKYRGPFCHLPGERQLTKYEGVLADALMWADVKGLDPALAWVIDWPNRSIQTDVDLYSPNPWEDAEISAAADGNLVLWVLGRDRRYQEELPEQVSGLSPQDRAALRQYIATPTRQHLDPVLAMAGSRPLLRSRRIRRFTDGSLVAAVDDVVNGNKPGCPAVVWRATSRASEWLCPSEYAGVGAKPSRSVLGDHQVTVWSDVGGARVAELAVALPSGEVDHEIIWDTTGIRRVGASTPPPANPVNPPAVNPPAVNPPAVNPPAVNPPAVNPPAVNPPAPPNPDRRMAKILKLAGEYAQDLPADRYHLVATAAEVLRRAVLTARDENHRPHLATGVADLKRLVDS